MTVKPTDFAWGVPVEPVRGQMPLPIETRTAGAVFSRSEQQSIIDEGEGTRASNLDRLDLTGTHYAPMDDIVRYNDDNPDFLW